METRILLTATPPTPGENGGPHERLFVVAGDYSHLEEFLVHEDEIFLWARSGTCLALPLHVDGRDGWIVGVEINGEELPRRKDE